MSAWLREKRAERSLRRDYRVLHARVVAHVRTRLGRDGIHVDDADLDAAYNQAWHTLHGQLLHGTEVANPPAFLAKVAYRRAVDEHRRLHVERRVEGADLEALADPGDLDARLDDRTTLRHLVVGLKEELSDQERRAATLCYLLGYTRAEAARELDVEPKRMGKVMDGVARKLRVFAADMESGAWCTKRQALMRAFASGLLEPDTRRHGVAVEHLAACPGCRSYVRSLRGLGGTLPPLLAPAGTGAGASPPLSGLVDRVRETVEGARDAVALAGLGGARAAVGTKLAVGTLTLATVGGAGAAVAMQEPVASRPPAPSAAVVPASSTSAASPAALPADAARERPTRTPKGDPPERHARPSRKRDTERPASRRKPVRAPRRTAEPARPAAATVRAQPSSPSLARRVRAQPSTPSPARTVHAQPSSPSPARTVHAQPSSPSPARTVRAQPLAPPPTGTVRVRPSAPPSPATARSPSSPSPLAAAPPTRITPPSSPPPRPEEFSFERDQSP